MKCLNCGKEFESKSDKARYCSGACSKAYRRKLHKGESDIHSDNLDSDTTRTFDFKLTRTDQQFEAESPGYYNFGKEVHDKKCFMCEKEFKTRLSLLKFCSLKCKAEFYRVFSPTGKK